MVKKIFIMAVVIQALTGCYDRFPGPGLQNALDADLDLSVTYTDGKVTSFIWSPGRLVLIGRGDLPEGGVQEVVVQKAGKTIHRLNRDEVRSLVEKQRNHHTHATWCVDQKEIYLFEPHPADTGGCVQGKRIE